MFNGLLNRVLTYAGSHAPADIIAGVADGRFQQWGNGDSIVVTEILDTPRRRILNFFLAEGTMAELEAMEPGILDWARSQGCTHATLVGREGWRRVSWMRESGWKFRDIVMEKEL